MKLKIPKLGLGTWRSTSGEVGDAVRYAITKAGYRHIDCAKAYENETEIGSAFKSIFTSGSKISRNDIFVTSKLSNFDHRPKDVLKACKKTLSDLKLTYLDLYLMHWGIVFRIDSTGKQKIDPISIQETWIEMEKLVRKGLVKSIGVSNFTAAMIIDLLTYAKIKPANNQVEIHPYNSQNELIDFCHSQDITVTAYSPIGGQIKEGVPHLLENPVVQKIAKNHKKTPAQIVLNWNINRGVVVIPKSTKAERILENSRIFDIKLTAEEMSQINGLNINYRTCDPSNMWGIPYFK